MSGSDRTRVCILIKGLGVGGAERLLERSIPYFNRQRFDYHVAYLIPWKNALVPAFEAAGIQVQCLNYTGRLDIGLLTRLRSWLRQERIELIHAHLPMSGILARFAKRATGVRWLVYTEHSLPARYRVMTRVLNATTYRRNDAVIAVSEEVATRVRPYVRAGRPRLVTIANAIDVGMFANLEFSRQRVCSEFGFPADARIVVTVGNLRAVKGHRYLLAAARRVLDQEPRARFLLVGLGPLADALAREAKSLGLNGQFVLTGFRPDATALIGAADLYVLPSLFEGLPVSLLEAMALGRPAVVTRVGGIPEVVVSNETAVLVAPADVDALAEQILALIGDPERRRRMGEMARQHVRRRYGMAEMVAAVENVYEQVIDR